MSSFDITQIVIEIMVTDKEETSKVIAFYHHPTGNKLEFGFEGMWLVNFEERMNKSKLPKENGHYKMKVDWDECSESVKGVWEIKKMA